MSNPEQAYDATQEVRIASVMFSGVSLAVYMNGITQELLRAVRATAPRLTPASGTEPQPGFLASQYATELLIADPQMQSTEPVYRMIGRTLFHGRTAGSGPVTTGPVRTRIV